MNFSFILFKVDWFKDDDFKRIDFITFEDYDGPVSSLFRYEFSNDKTQYEFFFYNYIKDVIIFKIKRRFKKKI